MRLIDADFVIDTVNEFKGKNRKTDLGIKLVEAIVSNAPTVDAEPIRHGHWVEVSPQECYKCSVCSLTNDWEDIYCPNCGAKMDAKGEDDAD